MRHHIQVARTALVLALLVALVGVGCGRRQPVSPSSGPDGVAAMASPAGASEATAPATSAEPTAAEPTDGPEPTPSATAAPASPAPFQAPDLTAIQRLLDDLEAALAADATADTEEGSAP